MIHKNLCCLKSLSAYFMKNCVHTLDKDFDANAYYRYIWENDEKFVIQARKNQNVTHRNKTLDVMQSANLYKGNYRMDFIDKHGKRIACKTNYIPVKLCEYPNKTLGYAKERVLAGTRSGINGFLLKGSNHNS